MDIGWQARRIVKRAYADKHDQLADAAGHDEVATPDGNLAARATGDSLVLAAGRRHRHVHDLALEQLEAGERVRHDLVLEFFTVVHHAVPAPVRCEAALAETHLLVEALADRTDRQARLVRDGFSIDLKLFFEHDTTTAIHMEKRKIGNALTYSAKQWYKFAEWCARRGVNLDEAEAYATRALEEAGGYQARAESMAILAEIYYGRGEKDRALETMQKASDEDPFSGRYHRRWKAMKAGL